LESFAFLQKFFPGCPVDGTIDPSSTQKVLIGRIDNGIDFQFSDVGLD
jgi:hypothetical protein